MGNSKFSKSSAGSGAGRKFKKRLSPLMFEDHEYIDYKNIDLLKKFMSERAKIKSREVTGNDVQQQREIARAIKNAREMGLLAYTSAVTTQRKGGRGRDRDDRSEDKRSNRSSSRDQNDKPETQPAEAEVAKAVVESEPPVEAAEPVSVKE